MRSRRRITFSPAETTVSVPAGYTVLDAARKAGLTVDSICGGKGTCGKCQVEILTREACELSDAERQISSAAAPDRRLACQTPVEDGMKVLISGESLDIGLKGKEIEGALFNGFIRRVKKEYLKLDPRTGPNPTSDWELLTRALPDLMPPGLKGLQQLSAMMHPSAFAATVASLDNEWLGIEAGDTEKKNYGLAVDLGTTTAAVYLADLHDRRIVASGAALNGQSPFGADVVSRISYVDAHPKGLATLQKAAVKTINKLLDDLMAKRSIDRENIYLITVVGNPTMLHLFLGLSPRGLAEYPFHPVFSDALTFTAFETGLNLPAHTKLEILPLVSAYVGADTVAAALAAGLDQPGPPRLLLDIGTNGELVLAVHDKIWACSTAAGPALEGGAITFGMRAVPGAISAVSINDDVALSVIGQRAARGLCGSGLLDVVAQLLDKGLISRTGRLQDAKGLPEGMPAAIRKRLTPSEKGQNFHLTPEVYLTQGDISQLQLAKGAMRAGIEILMAEAGITDDDVAEVMLAGAFGASLRPESLVAVGLLPPFPREKIKSVGNAAGVGALLCLLSEEHHNRALRLARRMTCLELSLRKDFQDRFMKGMQFLRF